MFKRWFLTLALIGGLVPIVAGFTILKASPAGASSNCVMTVESPVAIGSIYGPLIDTRTVVSCSSPASISTYGDTILNGVGVAGAGAAGYACSVTNNVYSQCLEDGRWQSYIGYSISEENGGPTIGATSFWNTLPCDVT